MQRYGTAILYVALAFAVKASLDTFVPQNPIFLPFAVAAAAAARSYGLGVAILTLMLGAGLASYFYLPPTHHVLKPRYAENLSLLTFVVEAGLLVWLVDRLRGYRWNGEAERDRLRQLVGAVTDHGFVLLDATGRVESWNAGAERVTGYSSSDALGRLLSCCFPKPPGEPEAASDDLRIVDEKGVAEVEGWRVRKDGSIYWARATTTLLRDGRGRPSGYAQVFSDLTRNRIKESLWEGQDRFQAAFEQAALGIAHVTPDHRCLLVNQALCRIVGYSSHDLVGKPFGDLTHPDDRAADSALVGRLLAAEIPGYEIELRYVRKDGTVVWVDVTASPVRNATGEIRAITAVLQDVTARKQAEDALRASEQRFRSLATAAPVGIFETDITGNCRLVNERWCRLAGLPAEEVQGRGWVGALHPEDRDRVAAEWYAATAEGREFASDYRFRTPRGEVSWLSGRALALRDQTGAVTGYLGTVTDITERKRAEDALRAGEQRLRLLTDTLPGLIAYVDADHRYRFANAAYQAWCGVPKEACTGRHVREVLGDATYEAIKGSIDSALTGRAGDYEARVTYPAAGARDVHVYQVPDRDESGRVVGFYLLVVDVTGQRAAEQAVRDREACLRTIVDTAMDAIVTIDFAGRIDSFNPAAERMFGFAAPDAIGQNVSVLMASPYREEHDAYLARYLRTGEKRLIGTVREAVARRRDGTTFPVEISVSEIEHSLRFTGILRDVSRRHELEREVLETSAREQRRIGLELHDGVGQELTGLGLMASALAQQLHELAPDLAGLADRIAAGLVEAHSHVRDLSRGLVPVAVGPEGLRTALDDLVARTAGQSGTKFTLDTSGSPGPADPDTATHLYRVAQEAVSNALRHSRAGHVWITLQGTADSLTLEVRDDGVGIAENVGNPAGLGMRLMRYRCGVMGGTLMIRPAEPAGTVVRCEVPVRSDHGQE